MPIISKTDLDPKIRQAGLEKYRERLKARLEDPSLTPEQRDRIRKALRAQ